MPKKLTVEEIRQEKIRFKDEKHKGKSGVYYRRTNCLLSEEERIEIMEDISKKVDKLSKQDRSINSKKMRILFIKAYTLCEANIAQTCRLLGIKRDFYYHCKKAHLKFKEAVEQVEESLIDLAESQLISNIKSGKEVSLLFFLKCKAKHRGYIERQEVELAGNVETTINIIPASKYKDDNNE